MTDILNYELPNLPVTPYTDFISYFYNEIIMYLLFIMVGIALFSSLLFAFQNNTFFLKKTAEI